MIHIASALYVGLLYAASPDVTPAKELPSRNQATAAIIESLSRQDATLLALAAEITSDRPPQLKDGADESYYTRRFVAARGPGSFFRDNCHGVGGVPWEDDVWRKISVLEPEGGMMLEHINRILTTFPATTKGRPTVTADRENLLYFLCWWPFTTWEPPDYLGRPWSMSSLLANGNYSLLGVRESISGTECDVLCLPQVDSMWVSVASPTRVLKRELYAPDGKSLAVRLEYSDHKEFRDRVLLPLKIRCTQFDLFAAPDDQRRMVSDVTYTLSSVRVNDDVVANDFKISVPPGTIRPQRDSKGEMSIELVRDGELEHLKSVVEWAERCRFTVRPSSGGESHRVQFCFGLLVGTLAVTVAYLVVGRALN